MLSSSSSSTPSAKTLLVSHGRLQNDLPPTHDLKDTSLSTLKGLLKGMSSTICSDMAKQIESMSPAQLSKFSMDNRDVAAMMLNSCALSYLDKSFYQCMEKSPAMKNKKGTVPEMLYDQLKSMSNNDLKDQPKMISHLNSCLKQNGDVMHLMKTKASSKEELNKDFYKYEKMMDTKYNISRSDTKRERERKMSAVEERQCASYKLPEGTQIWNKKNSLNGKAVQYEMSLCMTANLCADRLQKCMKQDGRGVYDCINDSDVFECYKK
jgi:arsenate reductase-like glutaredoxin family protein